MFNFQRIFFFGNCLILKKHIFKNITQLNLCKLNYHDQKIQKTLVHNIQNHWTAASTFLGFISSV